MHMKLLFSIVFACVAALYAQVDGSAYSLYKSPFAEQEQVSPDQFQDAVIRAARAKKTMNDISVTQNHRDFARAAYYYYSGQWDSAYAAYNSLRGRDASLTGSVVLRMAQANFKQERYAKMRETLRLEKNLENDKAWREAAARLRIEATMAEQTAQIQSKAMVRNAMANGSKTEAAKSILPNPLYISFPPSFLLRWPIRTMAQLYVDAHMPMRRIIFLARTAICMSESFSI